MNTRTVVATVAIAAFVTPAVRAQEALIAERLTSAMQEAARATHAAQADIERTLALSLAARQQSTQEREAAAQVREQSAREREATARARELAARHQDLYHQGRSALDRSEWDRAREFFAQVLAEKGDRADAAQYWMAYAQYKLGQAASALDSLRALERAFPDSKWLQEAKALELQMRGSSPSSVATSTDDELKLLALNSLIATDTEQALPILEKLLAGANSPQVKKRALFIVSQSKSPKARQMLAAAAKGSANPDLQMEALQYLGISGGEDNFKLLQEIYGSTGDTAIKRRILQAYMIGNRTESLVRAAKTEADAGLRKQAIAMLGASHATSELWELYRLEKDPGVRRAALEGLFISSDVDRLIEIAKTEKDVEVRRMAIRFLGVRREARTSAALVDIYWQPGQAQDIKRRVIEGLFIQDNAPALIDIAKKETDAVMKKDAVNKLSVMKSKEATAFLLELINK